MHMRMVGSVVLGVLAGCSTSFKGQVTGVVPQKSPADALRCLISAAEKNGFQVYTVDTVDTPGTAVVRKLESAADSPVSDPNEFSQGDELRLETASAGGQVSATVTPFLVRRLATRAGPHTQLDPPTASGIAMGETVLSACTGSAT